MSATIRARVKGGNLEPLDPIELHEGDEVLVTIAAANTNGTDWLERTAGGWAGIVDGEQLKRDIYESRSMITRREPRL